MYSTFTMDNKTISNNASQMTSNILVSLASASRKQNKCHNSVEINNRQ